MKELDYFLSIRRSENVVVLWTLIEPCLYDETPLEQFQAVHALNRPLAAMSVHEQLEVWVKLSKMAKDSLLSGS